MRFDEYGNLIGGIIKSNLDTVKNELVSNFPNSTTRTRNFDGLLSFIQYLKSDNVLDGVSRIFIDGSFCTSKVNPNDIDLVILTVPFSVKGDKILNSGVHYREFGCGLHLDVYFTPDFKMSQELYKKINETNTHLEDDMSLKSVLTNLEYQVKYWMGQFGFDRNEKSKAIISIAGGDLDVH